MKKYLFLKFLTIILLIISFIFVIPCFNYAIAKSKVGNSVADLRSGFKGVPWGASRDEFLRIRPDISIEKDIRNKEKFLSYNAKIQYAFTEDGRWFRMVIFVSEADKDSIMLDFAHYFGRPKDNKARWALEDLAIVVIIGENNPILIDGRLAERVVGQEKY